MKARRLTACDSVLAIARVLPIILARTVRIDGVTVVTRRWVRRWAFVRPAGRIRGRGRSPRCGWLRRASRRCAGVLLDRVEGHVQLVGDVLAGLAGGEQVQQFELAVAERSDQPRHGCRGRLLVRGTLGHVVFERPHQPPDVVPGDGGPVAAYELTDEGAHRGALVDEDPDVALGWASVS